MWRACLPAMLSIALLTAPAALGQSGGANPFGPLPQTPQAPPEPPEPQPVDPVSEDDAFGGGAFWLIIGTTGLLFVVIAFLITRDMRRSTGAKRKLRRTRGTGRPAAAAAESIAAESGHTPGSRRTRAKAQQRAKVKAARKQRRRSR